MKGAMENKNGTLKPYPVFLVGLENRSCIVAGGGHEAEYKVKGLLDCQATLTVISPTLTPQLEEWAEEGRFSWLNRAYQPGDLRGAFLVIAERSDPQRNAQIFEEAEAENALVNLIDDIPHCNFIAGSVVRQGDLAITISTSGSAPALAVRLRQRFEKEFGPEYGDFLKLLAGLRQPMSALIPDFQERRRRWYQLVDSDILELLGEGEKDRAWQRLVEILGDDFQSYLDSAVR
jgi:siroheme synthase-like protein